MNRRRRDFLKTSALAAVAAGCGPKIGGSKAPVKIGYVSPQTGPLGVFGKADRFTLARVLAHLEASQGLKLEVLHEDAKSDPGAAAKAAETLIAKGVKMMVVGFTPETTNPVARVCEEKRIPCVSSLSPNTPFLAGGPYTHTFHFFWDLDQIIEVFLGIWDKIPTNKVVAGMWPDDGDGQAWAAAFKAALEPKGYRIVDPGRYTPLSRSFTPLIKKWKDADAQILTGVPIPPDFATAWNECAASRFHPRVASIGKAILFPESIDRIGGDLPDGLTSEVWWSPFHPWKSKLTGKTPKDLVAEYSEQWTQHLGFVYALFEVAADAILRAGGADRDGLIEALEATNLETMAGRVHFGPSRVAVTPLAGGQWGRGELFPWELSIVQNGALPSLPAAAPRAIPSKAEN